MKKNVSKKRKVLRRIFQGLSLSSVAFVFQACYGTPQDFRDDVHIEGVVTSRLTNEPISGIKVSIENQTGYVKTDSTGQFTVYALKKGIYKVKFEDVDALQHGGVFQAKDTSIISEDITIVLNVALDAQ